MGGHRKILCASVQELPFTDKSFDLIVVLDVIYHLQVKNDFKALKECYRVLKKQGRILIREPAYDFLRSEHDRAVHTRHRYTKSELKMKMEQAGFKVERITYINTFLFPLITLLRFIKKLTKSKNSPRSDVKFTPALLNWILIFILTIEAQLLKIINFPFGLSILCIAQK